jgi:hypothetical protein
MGKILIIIGIVLIILGLVIQNSGKIPFIGKLPGDISIKRENFTFYFPIATSIVLSILISVILFLINRFKN